MENHVQYPFKSDHEFLIALIQDFNSSISSLDNRMREDHQDTLEIKVLLQKQYDVLSKRIEAVEQDLLALNPKELAQLKEDVRAHADWIQGFNQTKHIAWVIASTGFMLMGYFLPNMIATLHKLFTGIK